MQADDLELDALLQAQSSDDDDSDLAELERSLLDQILDSADLGIDVPLSSILASSEGFAFAGAANLDTESGKRIMKNKSQKSTKLTNVVDRWKLEANSPSFLNSTETAGNFVCGDSSLEPDNLALKNTSVGGGLVRSSVDMEASRGFNRGSETGSSYGAGSRASARPGAALAAAAAASRQVIASSSTTISRPRRTKSVENNVLSGSSTRPGISEPSPPISLTGDVGISDSAVMSIADSGSLSTMFTDSGLLAKRSTEGGVNSRLVEVGTMPAGLGTDLSGMVVAQGSLSTSLECAGRFKTVSSTSSGSNQSLSDGAFVDIDSQRQEESNSIDAAPDTTLVAHTSYLTTSSLNDVNLAGNLHQTALVTSLHVTRKYHTDSSSIDKNQVYEGENEQRQGQVAISCVSREMGLAIHDAPREKNWLQDSKRTEEHNTKLSSCSSVDSFNEQEVVLTITPTKEAGSKSQSHVDTLNSPQRPEPIMHKESDGEEEKSQCKALELAEELERRAATAGLHMEEGATAQPMRLEAIQRGRPGIGLMQVDTVGFLSQALGSPAMRHDHGFPQALAVHASYIAVGMSKGAVLVTASKYSGKRISDETDSKAFLLWGLSDKVRSAVNAMCFNQQGDLLLVGYASGALVLWDVPRARLNMTIVGEHFGAIVQAFILGQEALAVRHMKAITVDCTGRLLLHTFSFKPLLRRFAATSQCLSFGRDIGLVLAISPMLTENGYQSTGHGAIAPHEGATSIVALVTQSTIYVVCLSPAIEILASWARPSNIREGAIPYISWQLLKMEIPKVEDGVVAFGGGESVDWPLLAVAWDRRVIIAQLLRAELRVVAHWDLDNAAAGITWLEDKIVFIVTVKGKIFVFTQEGVEVENATLSGDQGGPGALMYHTHILNSFENPEKASHNSLAVCRAALYMLGPLKLWRVCLMPWCDRLKLLQGAGDWMEAFRFALELYDGCALGVTGLPRGIHAMREVIMATLLALLGSYIDEVFAYLTLALGSSPVTVVDDEISQGNSQSGESEEGLTGIETWGRANLGLDMVAVADEHYAKVGSMAIEFCLHIEKKEVIFERIYTKFEDAGQKDTFLELLEPYILKDMLGGLAPEVMQAFVEHYSRCGWLQRVEQCVLHMDISSLDFNQTLVQRTSVLLSSQLETDDLLHGHLLIILSNVDCMTWSQPFLLGQVVRLCRENGLYSALIYLFNGGLDDFSSPLEELLTAAQLSRDSIRSKALGYKLLVYLKYCFSGLAFPLGRGKLAVQRLPKLRTEILQFLLDQQFSTRDLALSHTAESTVYPRLWHLLQLDTQATLVVLRLAFPTEGPLSIGKQGCAYVEAGADNTADSLERISIEARGVTSTSQLVDDGIRYVQAVVNAVIEIINAASLIFKEDATELDCPGRSWPFVEDVGFVLEFVAQFVASRHAVVGSAILTLIVKYLTSSSLNKTKSSGKEELLARLLQNVPQSDWDLAYTLHLAQRAAFWQVSGWLYAQSKSHVAALDCYLEDKGQPQQPFTYIMQRLDDSSGLKGETLAEFRVAVLARIRQLMRSSIKGTLWVVLSHFGTSNEQVMKELKSSPNLLFAYLKIIMEACWGSPSLPAVGPEGGGAILQFQSSLQRTISNQEKIMSWESRINPKNLLQRSGIKCTNEMTEIFIQLLCRFEPQSVLKFLASCETYHLEPCLKLCQDYGITDAAIFLLERAGDVPGALELLLDDVNKRMHEFVGIASSYWSLSLGPFDKSDFLFHDISQVAAIQSALSAAVEVCQRNTPRLGPKESQSLWFSLLDKVVEPLHELTEALTGDDNNENSLTLSKKLSGSLERQKLQNKNTAQWEKINKKAGQSIRRWLVQLVGDIVGSMKSYVPSQVLMLKILSDYGGHPFGDFRVTISNMLSAHSYEHAILGTAKQLVEEATYYNLQSLLRSCTHAYAPKSSTCCICKLGLEAVIFPGDRKDGTSTGSAIPNAEESSKAIFNNDIPATFEFAVNGLHVFFCGHAAHVVCMDVTGHHKEKEMGVWCPVCFHIMVPRRPSSHEMTVALQNDENKMCQKQKLISENKSGIKSTTRSNQSSNQSRLELLNHLKKGKGLQKLGPRLHLPLAPPKKTGNHNLRTESSGFGRGRPTKRTLMVP